MVKTDASSTPHSGTSRYSFAVIGNIFYFIADDEGNYDVELWKSDGTTNGTVVVKDINIFGGDSDPSYLTPVGNTLYFSADDDVSEIELWKSDGTTNGTVLAADIHDYGGGNCCHSYPRDMTLVGNTLFLSAQMILMTRIKGIRSSERNV